MIHATVCVKTDIQNTNNLSSAGIILRFIRSDSEVEKRIGVYFGSCNNYNGYVRAMLVLLNSIKPEHKKEKIMIVFDKKTHISNILKSKKKDLALESLHKALEGVEYEVSQTADDHENKLLVQAATLANYSYQAQDNIL